MKWAERGVGQWSGRAAIGEKWGCRKRLSAKGGRGEAISGTPL